MPDLAALVTPPLLLDSTGAPANGDIYARLTQNVTIGTGIATPTQVQGKIINGQFKALDGSAFEIPVTPEGVGVELFVQLVEAKPFGTGSTRDRHSIRRVVSVPDQSTVTWDELIDTIPVESGGDVVVPSWVATTMSASAAAVTAAASALASEAAAEAAAAAVAPGAAGGTATLDGSAKVSEAQIPDRLSVAGLSDTIEAKTFVVDTDYATLEDALSATAVGGVLELRGAWARATPFTVNKACTVRFAQSGSITTSVATATAIEVTADRVTLDGPRLIGTGAGTPSSGKGIVSTGAVGTYRVGLQILNAQITDFSEYGIYLEFCSDFRVINANIANVSYAGMTFASCSNGLIDGGAVRNITQTGGLTNSYGITASRRSNSALELAAFPRPKNITVQNVLIDGVAGWTGLDTHGGDEISFIRNTVRNCLVGIAAVASSNNAAASTYAPIHAYIMGNKVYGAGLGTNSAGVWLVGSSTEQATGMVLSNTVEDMGGDTGTAGNNWGGIVLDQTRGALVAQNMIKRPAVAGIHVISSNTGLSLIGNEVEDVWSSVSAICSVVYVRSSPNTVTVSGTQITRGAKTATRVNNEGIRCNTSSTQVDGGGNQWTNAVTAVVSGSTAFQASVLGVTPVPRAAAIATPTNPGVSYSQVEAAAMKTAVDALRIAVKNFGITQ